jgi:hypothetical protein
MPIRHGGLGLRPSARILNAAYLGSALVACQDLVDARAAIPNRSRFQLPSVVFMNDAREGLLAQLKEVKCTATEAGVPTLHNIISSRNPNPHLQHDWVDAIEKRLVFNPSSDVISARRLAVTKDHLHPHLWLSTLPTRSEFTLRSSEFNQAIRTYLLIPPTSRADLNCFCRSPIAADPLHIHTCSKLRRGPVTVRHDSVVNQFKQVVEDHLIYTRVEPRVAPVGVEDRSKPDLELVGSRGVLDVEFSILHPCASSHVKAKDPHRLRESTKRAKYAAKCKEAGVGLGVVVLDVFGGLGRESEYVLKWCAREADELSADFLRKVLSFAVQRSNLLMIDHAFRSLHLGFNPLSEDYVADVD